MPDDTQPQAPAVQADEWMNYLQAAAYLGISLPAVKAAVARGSLVPVKPPRQRAKLLRRQDLDDYKAGRFRELRRAHTALAKHGELAPATHAHPAPVTLDAGTIERVASSIGTQYVQLGEAVSRGVTGEIAERMRASIEAAIKQLAQASGDNSPKTLAG